MGWKRLLSGDIIALEESDRQHRGEKGIMEKQKGRSRKKKKFPVAAAAIGTAIGVAAVGGAAGYYIYEGKQYETVFFPSTRINGIDASHKTVEEMEKLISAAVDEYSLTIKEMDGRTEQITGEAIGMHSVFDGKMEEYLAGQEPLQWWMQKDREKDYEIEAMVAFDQELLEQQIDNLGIFHQDDPGLPQDAYLSDYVPGQGYVVMPDVKGTVPDREKAGEEIRAAVKSLRTELDLAGMDVYERAAVTADDQRLHDLADRLNKYVNMTVTYTFGEEQEVLDGELISQWISLGEEEEIFLDQEAVTAYVKGLAERHNTASRKKVLKTSYGQTVEIERGTYGWRIDQAAEAEQLYQILLSGESQVREPVYRQTGASHGDNDYGNTYVEINLTAQHLFFYKDGQLLVESDFVSGNAARGYDTPSGAYPLTYKQRNATLRGADYATPVSYWMPFNGNIGMHDATWRGSFGGSIYRTNGSHGCINLPKAAAKTIFENIEKGMPVLCYHLGGTESGKSSAAGGGQGAPAPAPAPAPVPDPAETTAPADPESSGASGDGEMAAGQESSPEAVNEQETERTGLPWEYGPGMTEAETSAEPGQPDPGQSEPSPEPGPGQPESSPQPEPGPGQLESSP